MAAGRSGVEGAQPRELEAVKLEGDAGGAGTSESKAVASSLVRRTCCVISLGILLGTGLELAFASSCCRRSLLHVDSWAWVASAIVTLLYFCLLCSERDEEFYHPLTTDEERPTPHGDRLDAGLEDAGRAPADCLQGRRPESGLMDRSLGGSQVVTESGAGAMAVMEEPVKGVLDEPERAELAGIKVSAGPPVEDEDQAEDVAVVEHQVLEPPGCGSSQVECGCVPQRQEKPETGRWPSASRRLFGGSSRQLQQRTQGFSARLRAPLSKCTPPQHEAVTEVEVMNPEPMFADVEEVVPAPAQRRQAAAHSMPAPEEEEAGRQAEAVHPTQLAQAGPDVQQAEARDGAEEIEQPQIVPVQHLTLGATTGAAGQERRGEEAQQAEGETKPEASRRPCCCCCVFCLVLGALLAGAAVGLVRFRPDLVGSLRDETPEDLRRQAGSLAGTLRDDLDKVDKEVGRRFFHPGRTPVTENLAPRWHVGEWAICSTECGHGRSKRLVYCVSNGSASNCNGIGPAPPSSRSCSDDRGCKWHLGQWGKCDTDCGSGTMSRNVSCATGKDCHRVVAQPPTQAPCEQTTGCRWDVQPWEACRTSCGPGSARRIVTCANGPLESCLKHSAPPAVEQPCHNYSTCQWRPNEWGRCSNSCGSGRQRRNVSCAQGMAADNCKKEEQSPRLVRGCHDVTGCRWQLGHWSDCSTSCGAGTQKRTVTCATGNVVDCLAHSPMPPLGQSCTAYHGCRWTTGAWGACVSKCGSGIRRRLVTCANGAVASCRLGVAATPEDSKPCYNASLCTWGAGPWSPCSNVCGKGRRYRTVHCTNGWEVDCKAKEPPPTHEGHCSDSSGCLPLQGVNGCECFSNELVMMLAGSLDALSGWSISFAVMHKLVSLAPAAGRPPLGAAALLSAPAVLIAGLGALAAASVLQAPALLPDVIPSRQVSIHGRSAAQIQGVLGLGLWLPALGVLCCLGQEAPRRPRCALSMVLLSLFGTVLIMAGTVPPGRGTLGPVRRLEGDLRSM